MVTKEIGYICLKIKMKIHNKVTSVVIKSSNFGVNCNLIFWGCVLNSTMEEFIDPCADDFRVFTMFGRELYIYFKYGY